MEALRERIRKAISSQRPKTVTILSSLLAVQDDLGYIPPEAIEEVARFTRSTINDVWAVATFYTNFRFTPPGRHTVEVCWGPACHLAGAMRVIREVAAVLGLEGEGDTPDGRVTLRFNTCLGACAQGPLMSIDHRVIGRLTPERARELVQRLNGKSPEGRDGQ